MKKYLISYLKGVLMGAADVVPGVSGGTIAFITGIYERLISSLASINKKTLRLFFTGKWKAFFKEIQGGFLLSVFLGVATSILLLVNIILFLLEHHGVLMWSFFGGLIVASAFTIARTIKTKKFGALGFGIIGLLFGVWVTGLPPMTTPDEHWFIFLAGAIAICAMILPGISGSFLLLIMGQYIFILTAIKGLQLDIILVFGLGALVGLIAFSKVLKSLLEKHHNPTIGFLTGVMLGSLQKVWPWKEVLTTYTDRHGVIKPLVEQNILPTSYEQLGHDPQVLLALLMFVIGFLLVFGSEIFAKSRKIKN